MRPFPDFRAPATVAEALAVLEEKGSAARVLAGGTDVMVRVRRGAVPPEQTTLLSLHRIADLRGVRREGESLVIGAATTATDLGESPVVREHAPILGVVADRVASAQIRNLATIGGNLANASPAGDLINPLLLLDATLRLVSASGERDVPTAAFFLGPGETVRRPDELLAEIRLAIPPPERVFRFEKAGTRPAMECSVITVGLAYTPRDGALADVRVALGSAAPTPLRARAAEAALEGKALTEARVEEAARAASAEASPIDDVRGTSTYRRVLVAEFLRRLLHGD